MPYNLKENLLQPIYSSYLHRELQDHVESVSHKSVPQHIKHRHKSASSSSSLANSLPPSQFLTPDEVHLISQKLLLPQTRISALQSLASEEALHNAAEHWESLKRGLRLCLVHPKTSSLSLKIHLRLMKYDNLSAKESYVNMTEAVMEMVESSSIQEQGVMIIKALIEFNKELPSSWIRYPEQYIEEMISAFMNLLSILPKSEKVVPLQIMCMVDPGSGWMREWFLNDFGRSRFLKLLPHNLLIYLSQESTGILKYYSRDNWEKLSRARSGVLEEPLLSYSVFLTSYHFILQCLKYKKGRQKLISELGAETPISIFTEIIEFIIKTPSSGPLEYITKLIQDVIAFNNTWIIEEYFIKNKLLSKVIASLRDHESSRFAVLVLKSIYSASFSTNISLLSEDKENEIILRFCLSAFQREVHSVPSSIMAIIELSQAYLSTFHPSIQSGALTLIDSLCFYSIKAEELVARNKLYPMLVSLYLTNPLYAKAISRHKEVLKTLLKEFPHIRDHPRSWIEDLDNCIHEKGLFNLSELHFEEEEESWDPWDEKSASAPKPILETLLAVVLASNAPERLLNHLKEDCILSHIRLLTSLAYLSLDFYLFLESSYNLRQRYKKLYSELGPIIDEDALRLGYFLLYTKSIGSLEEKSLNMLMIDPESDLEKTRVVLSYDEENEGEEENDFLRFLEIPDEENWLEKARARFECLPQDINLSRRTLIKLFDRIYPFELEENNTTELVVKSNPSCSMLPLVVSLFQNYRDINCKGNEWEKDLRGLQSLFGVGNSFNWHLASLYFSSNFDITKRMMNSKDFSFSRESLHYYSEMIMFQEDPYLYSYLTEKSILPSIVFEKWVRQSFFNVLPWKEIRRYLALIALFGIHYVVFICIAICRHHRLEMIKMENKDPSGYVTFIEGISLFSVADDFRLGNYLAYMKLLNQKYYVSLSKT